MGPLAIIDPTRSRSTVALERKSQPDLNSPWVPCGNASTIATMKTDRLTNKKAKPRKKRRASRRVTNVGVVTYPTVTLKYESA